jgi:hypothetical protein
MYGLIQHLLLECFLFGTILSLKHRVPSTSSWKQFTFGSASCILLLRCAIPSSFFYAAMISSLNRVVTVMLCSDKSGNTQMLDSSPVKQIASKKV